MRVATFVLGVLLITGPALGQEDYSPHRMVGADGELDTSKCGVCHTESFELARPKSEVCTLCHALTTHSGAIEHLEASPVQVAQAIAAKGSDSPPLPVTEDGRIYCGTCHLFHDPSMGQDKPLASAWLPATTGLPAVLRDSIMAQARLAARKRGVPTVGLKFSRKGTTALRLAVEDGSLCTRCHGSLAQ